MKRQTTVGNEFLETKDRFFPQVVGLTYSLS